MGAPKKRKAPPTPGEVEPAIKVKQRVVELKKFMKGLKIVQIEEEREGKWVVSRSAFVAYDPTYIPGQEQKSA